VKYASNDQTEMGDKAHIWAGVVSRLWARRGLALIVLIAALLASAQAVRAAAPAGASIVNVASLSYRSGGSEYGTASNLVSVTVDETIDFSVVPLGDLTVTADARNQGVAFRLTNLGNGRRAFAMALDPAQAGDGFDPTACRIYIDRADLAQPNLASAQPYGRGETLSLAAGEAVTIWAVCDIPAEAGGTGRVALTARPVLAANDSAVPLWAPDRATAVNTYRIDAGLTAELLKSQSVVDAMGRARAIKGATVTYTLAAKLAGEGVAHDLVVTDPIPPGSTYVPGSLRLNGESLTDSADADIGQAGAEGVVVRLGDVAAPALRTVTFQVLINP
jgi:uncharacterized repeat protein (TIGR01451 family)